MKSPKFEIIAGTYEEFLLGFNFISPHTELVQTFAIHEHSSSIRCTDACGHYVASGAADDKIIVYDLRQRKEQCMLNYHDATVNCVRFTDNHSHLISGSSDGTLAIVRVGSWQLEKTWPKAHKGSAILDIAVHNSGKLALTLGTDCALRTWNLVKGRQAFVVNLNSKSKDPKSLEKIIWAEDGVRFMLLGGKYTEIWSIETGGVLKVIEHDVKVTSCAWISNDNILVGYEDGQVASIDINDCSKRLYKAHDGRVKALAKHGKWVISASSSGQIKVWTSEMEEVSKYETGCRITCLTVVESTMKIKEEDEGIHAEIVEEEIVRTPIKKSSVIIEVESDSESNRIESDEREKIVKKSKTKAGNTENSKESTKKKGNKKRQLESGKDEETVQKIEKKRKLKQKSVEATSAVKKSVKKLKKNKKKNQIMVDT